MGNLGIWYYNFEALSWVSEQAAVTTRCWWHCIQAQPMPYTSPSAASMGMSSRQEVVCSSPSRTQLLTFFTQITALCHLSDTLTQADCLCHVTLLTGPSCLYFIAGGVCQGQARLTKFTDILLYFAVSGPTLLLHNEGAALNCTKTHLHLCWFRCFARRNCSEG